MMDVYIYKKALPVDFSSGEILAEAAAGYAAYCGRKLPDNLQVVREGKPVFANWPGVEFSVSHSGEWWVCAFADRPVGLDVQEHRPCPYQRLAERWFHPDEQLWLSRQTDTEEAFYTLWTARESFVKMTGQGIDSGFSCFSVIADGLLRKEIGGGELRQLPFADGYSLCVCIKKEIS